MVLFNYSTKEITAKIVYYGPGLCGKTTNLQFVYDNLPGTINKGKMLSLATKTDRTLFFDFLPIDLGTIRGMRTRLQLYTVPGQVFYNTTRKLVLKGADGVVFVADSQKRMLDANLESLKNLEENLAEHDMKLADMPMIIQFNKRDLPDVASIDELNAAINKHNAPIYEGVATTGIGVHETLKAITRLVLNSLKEKYSDKREQKSDPPAQVIAAATAATRTSTAAQPLAGPKAAPRAAEQKPAAKPAQPAAVSAPQATADDPFADLPSLEMQDAGMSAASSPFDLPVTPEPPRSMGSVEQSDPFASDTLDDNPVSLLEISDDPVLVLDDEAGLLADPLGAAPAAPELERFEEPAFDTPTLLDATEEIFQTEMPVVPPAASAQAAVEDALTSIAMPEVPDFEPASEGVWMGQDPADEIEVEPVFEAETAEPVAHAPAPASQSPTTSPGRFEDDRLSIPYEGGESVPISTTGSTTSRRVVALPAGAQEINLPISLEIAGRRIDLEIRISLDLAEGSRLASHDGQGSREAQAARSARS